MPDHDDLDEMIWQLNHEVTSHHWVWRLVINRTSRWNLYVRRLGRWLDPPRGQPTPGIAVVPKDHWVRSPDA